MNKKLIVGIVLVAVAVVLGVFAMLKMKAKATEKANFIQACINRAEANIGQGDLLGAREIYTNTIEENPDNEAIKDIQKKLEDLNVKILFSPVKTDDSDLYVVKSGDNLGKIAKSFNTTVELIKKSNNLTSDIIHPGKKLKVTTAKFSILVDKSQNMLTLKLNDNVLKVYAVSTGLDNSTPVGDFKIVNKLIDPVWYKAGAIVASGSAENILGSRWLGITLQGYGIHGTTQPETIGKQATAGCVRMLNQDVEELYAIVPVGADVSIVD